MHSIVDFADVLEGSRIATELVAAFKHATTESFTKNYCFRQTINGINVIEINWLDEFTQINKSWVCHA